jgi:hypothetical protein
MFPVCNTSVLHARGARRFTELDVNDAYMPTRGDGYEQFYLAGYSHAQVGGIVLWGWAKEAISPGQDSRAYTSMIASRTVRFL